MARPCRPFSPRPERTRSGPISPIAWICKAGLAARDRYLQSLSKRAIWHRTCARALENRLMKAQPLRLGVNIDHVATMRNARGGPLSRPDPRRAPGGARRRRRHHRASARGPPAYPRPRHGAPQAAALRAAQFRDGGDARDDRPSPPRCGRMRPASCRKSARSAPPRAASTSSAGTRTCAPAIHELLEAGHPRLALRRARRRR